MKRLLHILILSVSLALIGCTDQEIKTEEVEQIEVTLSVTIPEEVEAITSIEPFIVSADKEDTIIDVTKKTDIELDMNGTGENAYVEGINGLSAFDEGPESGWLVKVNDEFIDVGPGSYVVTEDDAIEWLYTTDFNEAFE